MNATEVTAGLAESNGSLLLGLWRDSLHVTCGLTACTPGSALGPTLGNEYGKTLSLHCKWTGVRWSNLAKGHITTGHITFAIVSGFDPGWNLKKLPLHGGNCTLWYMVLWVYTSLPTQLYLCVFTHFCLAYTSARNIFMLAADTQTCRKELHLHTVGWWGPTLEIKLHWELWSHCWYWCHCWLSSKFRVTCNRKRCSDVVLCNAALIAPPTSPPPLVAVQPQQQPTGMVLVPRGQPPPTHQLQPRPHLPPVRCFYSTTGLA